MPRLTRIEVIIIAGLCLFLLAILPVACRKARTEARESICARNLALLGQAMSVYANDYDGMFPRAGGRMSGWGPTVWNAPTRYHAFGIGTDGTGGLGTIGSCLYLLVKYMDVAPETFICPADRCARVFKLSEYAGDEPDLTLTDLWDFGPSFGEHYSYAYHMPFSPYALTTSRDPALPVLADRTPWMVRQPFEKFRPDIPPYDGTAEQARAGNTTAHDGTGQNVLFLDGHVAFKNRPFCGLDNDNIYTISDKPEVGSPAGEMAGPGRADPRHARDSVLLTDPAPYRNEVSKEAREVDSRQLEQTAVLATLDCPVPAQRNAIWCSTFQMAWDQFKEKLVGEPIAIPGAAPLAGRLNNAAFPLSAVEPSSYYTAVGTVADGILDQIQRDMARRFPSAPVPAFDERHQTLPDVKIAYAYLGLNIDFAHPFYANEEPFAFTASNGAETDVTSFSTRAPGKIDKRVREQVEVLHYAYGETTEDDTFVVDLCDRTAPYQVVLARVPIGETLREAVLDVNQAISQFKADPDYETLRRLRPIDTLTVPDVLYKLVHHFTELEGQPFGNAGWTDMPVLIALQTIDFSLSRTGVVLRSAAISGAARSRPRLDQPRHLRFDRPFLIYVRKRQADGPPCFVMWVDNAELLKAYEP